MTNLLIALPIAAMILFITIVVTIEEYREGELVQAVVTVITILPIVYMFVLMAFITN